MNMYKWMSLAYAAGAAGYTYCTIIDQWWWAIFAVIFGVIALFWWDMGRFVNGQSSFTGRL